MGARASYDITIERGIRQRHVDTCPARNGKRCTCDPKAFIASASVAGRRRYSPTLRSLVEARAWRGRALGGDLPIEQDPGDPYRAVWATWVAAARAGRALTKAGTPYRPRAIDDYDQATRSHVLPLLGDTPVRRLTTEAVQRAMDRLSEQGVSPSRVASAATATRAVVRWASRRGIASPLGPLELPRVPKRTPTVLMPDDVAGLLTDVDNDGARLAAGIAVYAGFRALEIVQLEPAQINIGRGRLEILAGKTDAAARTVPIVAPLRAMIEAANLSGSLAGDSPPRSTYTVVARQLQRAWKTREPRPTLHVLRHNFVSWALAAGVPLPSVQAISGHKTPLVPGVTLGVYGHVAGDHVEDARQRLDQWIAGQSSKA